MRVSKDPAVRKQELVDAALAMFIENGYEKTSVKDIVAKVGVAQGLFYYYFPSKEDVVKEIAEQYRKSYIDALIATGYKDCDSPLDMIRLLLRGNFVYLKKVDHLVSKMHMEGNIVLHDTITYAMIDALADLVTEIMIIGTEKGFLNYKFPERTAKAFIYGIMYTIHSEDSHSFVDFEDQKDFIIYYTAQLFHLDEETLKSVF